VVSLIGWIFVFGVWPPSLDFCVWGLISLIGWVFLGFGLLTCFWCEWGLVALDVCAWGVGGISWMWHRPAVAMLDTNLFTHVHIDVHACIYTYIHTDMCYVCRYVHAYIHILGANAADALQKVCAFLAILWLR